MRKTIHSANHKVLCELLREVREEAGLTQTELAVRIKKDQTFVSKYETGERRLDVLELREICVVLGVPIGTFIRRLERRLSK